MLSNAQLRTRGSLLYFAKELDAAHFKILPRLILFRLSQYNETRVNLRVGVGTTGRQTFSLTARTTLPSRLKPAVNILRGLEAIRRS